MNGINCTYNELTLMLDSLPDRVLVLSESGVILDVFGGADTNVSYASGQLIGTLIADVIDKNLAKHCQLLIKKVLCTGKTQHCIYSLHPRNFSQLPEVILPINTQWYEGRINPLPMTYKGQRAVIWIARNITANHDLQEKLLELSRLDELTQILNRRGFDEILKQCFSTRKRYGVCTSLMIIDIDNFKFINDSFGHPFGDKVIEEIAALIKEESRDSDNVARLGGDEFCVVLNHTSITDATSFAERVRKIIENHTLMFLDTQVKLSVSIGVSQVLGSDKHQSDVLQRADSALYKAKLVGRNRVATKIENIIEQNLSA